MDEETVEPNKPTTLMDATEELIAYFSKMKKKYHLSETMMMDLFRVQLMWLEQDARNIRQQASIDETEKALNE